MAAYRYHLKNPVLRNNIDLRLFSHDFMAAMSTLEQIEYLHFVGSIEVLKHEYVITSENLTDGAIRVFGKIFATYSELGRFVKAYRYNEGKRSGQLFIRIKN